MGMGFRSLFLQVNKGFSIQEWFWGTIPHTQIQRNSLLHILIRSDKLKAWTLHHLKTFRHKWTAKKFWMTLLRRWTSLCAPPDLANNHWSLKSATKVYIVSNYLPLCKTVDFMLYKHISLWKTSLPIKIAFDSPVTISCSKCLKHLLGGRDICSPHHTGESFWGWQIYRWDTSNELYKREMESFGT